MINFKYVGFFFRRMCVYIYKCRCTFLFIEKNLNSHIHLQISRDVLRKTTCRFRSTFSLNYRLLIRFCLFHFFLSLPTIVSTVHPSFKKDRLDLCFHINFLHARGILDNVPIKGRTIIHPLRPSSPPPPVTRCGIINRYAAAYRETTRSILGHDRSPVIRLVSATE